MASDTLAQHPQGDRRGRGYSLRYSLRALPGRWGCVGMASGTFQRHASAVLWKREAEGPALQSLLL